MTELDGLGQAFIELKEQDVAPDDLRLWSVTTILKVLASEGLMRWAVTETAKAAVSAVRGKKAWLALVDEDPDEALKMLENARFKRVAGQRTAAELGTAVHDACEEYALTGTKPAVDDEVQPFIDRFQEFLEHWQPEYQATEVTVYSPTYGYAGRCDAFLTIDGFRFIGDYKTHREDVTAAGYKRKPYGEAALQLAAYRYAEMAATWRPRVGEKYKRRYYAISPTEQALAVRVPEVDGGAVINLTPTRCDLYPVRCDENVHEAFLFVLEAARWSFQTSQGVIGEPMTRGGR